MIFTLFKWVVNPYLGKSCLSVIWVDSLLKSMKMTYQFMNFPRTCHTITHINSEQKKTRKFINVSRKLTAVISCWLNTLLIICVNRDKSISFELLSSNMPWNGSIPDGKTFTMLILIFCRNFRSWYLSFIFFKLTLRNETPDNSIVIARKIGINRSRWCPRLIPVSSWKCTDPWKVPRKYLKRL